MRMRNKERAGNISAQGRGGQPRATDIGRVTRMRNAELSSKKSPQGPRIQAIGRWMSQKTTAAALRGAPLPPLRSVVSQHAHRVLRRGVDGATGRSHC
mmetsp:Transcript_6761/g.14080  ORF Transcript_6761/g.14080 Transcript_6761/m.14080 type:complete len:98 (+) Transcript_6761:208-501(+)